MGEHKSFGPAQDERQFESKRVYVANPRGFCAGVTRAIDAVERALLAFGPPVYVRRAIVHNKVVVARLEELGAVFIQEVEEVPEGSLVILSAHGVAEVVTLNAAKRGLRVIDGTCPLVAKVHAEVSAHCQAGRLVILIGHASHPEVVGTRGRVPDGAILVVTTPAEVRRLDLRTDARLAYAVQTTFSVREADTVIEAIRKRFSDVAAPRSGHICYATTNRQVAVEAIASRADYFLVVGDDASSNANRLVEVAVAAGCEFADLIGGAHSLNWCKLERANVVGLSAGASTPDSSVREVCAALVARGFEIVELDGVEETAVFKPVTFNLNG